MEVHLGMKLGGSSAGEIPTLKSVPDIGSKKLKN
jgi:hypothetical protein